SRHDDAPHRVEVLVCVPFAPRAGRRERLEAQRRAARVAGDASRVARPLRLEDRLDLRLEDFVIEGGPSGGGLCLLGGPSRRYREAQRSDERCTHEDLRCFDGHHTPGAGARTARTSRRRSPVLLTPWGTPSGATSISPARIGTSRPSSRKTPFP